MAKKRFEHVKQSNIEANIAKYMEQGSIYIPYSVVSSKNSRKIVRSPKTGKQRVIASDQYRQYKSLTEYYYLRQKKYFLDLIKDLPKPIHLGFHHIRFSRERWDFHNMAQGPADLMQEYGWIPDDDCTNLYIHPDGYTIDKENQGLVITPYNKVVFFNGKIGKIYGTEH